MVGDIKQGIYLFRYANPRLFSARVGASQRCDPDKPVPPLSSHQNGYLGLLNRNFRSRPGIIDFVNDVFSAFLTESSGEIEYDETQWLEAGRPDAELTEKCDPLHIPEVTWEIATFVDDVDTDEDNELDQDLTIEMPDTKTKTEAFIAARMIGEL